MMNLFYKGNQIIMIAILLLISGCNEEIISERDYPRIDLHDEITQTDSSVTFSAVFLTQSGDIIEKGFIWLNGHYESRVSCGSGYEDGEFHATVTYDLTIGSSCSVRAYAVTNTKTIYSRPVNFISETNGVKQSISIFSPLSGQIGDTISIYGKNLSFSKENVKVMFGEASATIVCATDTLIEVLVPSDIAERECIILVEINQHIAQGNSTFKLLSPVIYDFEPKVIAGFDDHVNIYGSGFSDNMGTVNLQIGGFGATIISSSYDQITATISDSLVPDLDVTVKKLLPVEIVVAGKKTAAKDSLLLNYTSAWTRLGDFPGHARRAAVMFSYNGYGYYGLGSNADFSLYYSDLWRFDPENDTWVELAPFPSIPRIYSAIFRINKSFYLIGGNTGDPGKLEGITAEIWRYNIDENSWEQMADFKYGPRMHSEGLSNNNKGFIISGYENDFVMGNDVYAYNAEFDTWHSLDDDKYIVEGNPMESIRPRGFSGTDLVYLSYRIYPPADTRYLRSYNPVTNKWVGYCTYIGDAPGFFLNDLLYIGPIFRFKYYSEYKNQILILDPADGRRHYGSFKGEARNEVCNFAIGDYGYFLCGYRYMDEVMLQDVWKFDPSKYLHPLLPL